MAEASSPILVKSKCGVHVFLMFYKRSKERKATCRRKRERN